MSSKTYQYEELKEKMFENQTVKDIFDAAKEFWVNRENEQ